MYRDSRRDSPLTLLVDGLASLSFVHPSPSQHVHPILPRHSRPSWIPLASSPVEEHARLGRAQRSTLAVA
jgi:hypothetical protein